MLFFENSSSNNRIMRTDPEMTGSAALAWISAVGLGFSLASFLQHNPLRSKEPQRDGWKDLYSNSWSRLVGTIKIRLQQVPWWVWLLGSFGLHEQHAQWVWFPLAASVMAIPAINKTAEETSTNQSNDSDAEATTTSRNVPNERTTTRALPPPPPPPPPPPTREDGRPYNFKMDSDDALSVPATAIPSKSSQRYVEMLVHNVSHTDLVLSLGLKDKEPYCLCRPRFSAFDMYSSRIRNVLATETPNDLSSSLIYFPSYKRQQDDVRRSILPSPQNQLPTGFHLPPQTESLRVAQLTDLRVRGKDSQRLNGDAAKDLCLNAVFFPLLATLLPRWQAVVEQKYAAASGTIDQVLLLVSGVGTPRNWTHSIKGNSTQACAELMQIFVQALYPNVKVVLIHSETNIFRYDENILFVERELMPRIHAYRDAHAQGLDYPSSDVLLAASTTTNRSPTATRTLLSSSSFNVDWHKSFSVILSFADGSPARTHAIQAALRTYRPAYFHFWQLKSFWHETKIVHDDIEVHSFEEMNTVPALEASSIADPFIRLVVDEMKKFQDDIYRIVQEEQTDNDLMSFWLRKSHKLVLSVLLVQTQGQTQPSLYRGTNMEVSLPTGSLCAERNVIGTALAENPNLKRQDLKLIACLAFPELPHHGGQLDDDATSRSATPLTTPTLKPTKSTTTNVPDLNLLQDWVVDGGAEDHPHDSSSLLGKSPPRPVPVEDFSISRQIKLYPAHHGSSSAAKKNKRSSTSNRSSSQGTKRMVEIRSSKDLNPLRPCGSCNEWLKKISEANPYFKILTFTDAECNGVYVTPCQD